MKSKIHRFNIFSFLFICLLTILSSCTENSHDKNSEEQSLAEIVVGNYSGDGIYMPFRSEPLDLPSGSVTCYTPNWMAHLKMGSSSAIVTSVNDSTVSIILIGTVYTIQFNRDFVLHKNGNSIIDANGYVRFVTGSQSLQLTIRNVSPTLPVVNECIPESKYYFVRKRPSDNRYYCYTIETWEFVGTK